MNKEEPYRNQAERSKRRIQKMTETVEEEYIGKLPPREQVHRQKKKKTKWRVKYPVIRLLVLCFILLPIIIFSVISYRESGKKVGGAEKTSGNSVGYEINLDETNQKDESKDIDLKQDESKESESKNDEQALTETEQVPSEQSSIQNETSVNKQVPDQNNTPKEETSQVPINANNNTVNNNTVNNNVTSDNKTEPASKVVYHTVQPHETLFKLAIKYYQSQKGIEIIKNANNLQTEEIQVGQVLKIPLNN